MNVLHNFFVEIHGLELPVIEAPETVSDPKDLIRRHAVVFKSENNVLNDVVETRAQPSTGHHSCCDLSSSTLLEWASHSRRHMHARLCSVYVYAFVMDASL